MNDVIKTILYRRSVRKYKPEQISEKDLNTILTAGLYAPSGGNHQHVRLFVLQNPDTLSDMNKCIRDTFANRDIVEGQYQNTIILQARKEGYHFMFHAPTLISAINLREHENSMADSATALQNMLLAAKSLGLGACWINQPHRLTDLPELRRFFAPLGLREDEDIFGSVAVGYPGAEPVNLPSRKEGRVVTDRAEYSWIEVSQ